MTISFTTPNTVYGLGGLSLHFQVIVSPTGFSSFVYLANASLTTTPDESLGKAGEKSRPAMNCQPTVLPCSMETASVAKLSSSLGSLPFQSNPLFPLTTSVTLPMEADMFDTTPVPSNSFLNTSIFPL